MVAPEGLDEENSVAELSARALCSNRHLPEYLPVGPGGADFKLLDQSELSLACIAGPTPPRESLVKFVRGRAETANAGAIAWRLINFLSLNHLGIVERGGGERRSNAGIADPFRRYLRQRDRAADLGRPQPSIPAPSFAACGRPDGVGVARGVEITVTFDEDAFEGSGAFLLGAILDRFFSEYASLNHFTQTVIRTLGRGEIMRWPVRVGVRRLA